MAVAECGEDPGQATGTAPPSSLGTGSALTPNLLASGPRVERNAELIPEGLSEDRISKDWAIQSPAGRALLTVLISNSEE